MKTEGEIQGYRRTGHDYRQPWFYMITMTTLDLKSEILKEVAGGAVIISPFISPGEKEIALSILNADYGDVILMNPNGLGPCFRPKGKYFDLCAKGRLLILSAFPYTAQETPLTKEVCERMNAWCQTIAGVNA